MTTYTIDPINNKMVSNNDSKDLKRLKDLKKEKPFQKILQNKVKPLSAEDRAAYEAALKLSSAPTSEVETPF